jgi:Subtilase family
VLLFGALVPIIVALSASAAPGGSTPAENPSKLTKHDFALLAKKRAQGAKTVTLLVAAELGANPEVAAALENLGGTVHYRNDRLGYIRVELPLKRAYAAGEIADIEAANVDELVPLPDPRPEGEGPVLSQPAPGAGTPRENPYMPTRDTNAAEFVDHHRSWDGRGVTIGILDSGIDLHHPSLNTTSTGERKIVDWVTYTHPVTDNDPTWVATSPVTAAGGTFTVGTTTYTAPANGDYRFGTFNERDSRLGGELGNDVNRDGNPAGSNGVFGVLWQGDTVWVDTNQNLSFADETGMQPYKVDYDVGTFGTDNPATAVREALPFVVQYDTPSNRVNIGIVSGAHGSHVAGIAAGNRLFGGQMSGAAPGAKIVSVRVCLFIAGCTSHALIEGMIFAATHPAVDVINMSIGGLPALNDGNNTRAILYNRLITDENVQMFISAGNSGPGVNTIGDPSVASKVMSVGSYIHRDSWLRNYGSAVSKTDNLHPFTSMGPAENGGFKPQIVAPGSAISSIPTWQAGGPVTGTYELPPGYAMFNGTSMAAPQAAGAAALLISAAKQAHQGEGGGDGKGRSVEFRSDQLRQAMNSSARYLDGTRYQAHEQGNGLLDVDKAWKLLRRNIETVQITSRVPSGSPLAGFLEEPGFGTGIYDQQGVVGQSYVRTYTFKRTSGPDRTIKYHLDWTGNDGTFESAAEIRLPLNVAVELLVTVRPTSVGRHGAILNLDEPRTAGIDYQTMNVVVAAEKFSAANGYTITHSGSIERNQAEHYFFEVPAGTPAFKVDIASPRPGGFAAPGNGQVRFLRFHPWGVPVDSNSSLSCYNPQVAVGGSCAGNPASRTVTNPQAGVWEITVEARRTSDTLSAPYSLTASILGATVSPNPDVIPSATIGTPISRSYTLTNLFGPFTGRAVGTTLGSARLGPFTIGHLEQQQYATAVSAGSTSFRATIGSPSDPAADLDLFVFRCAPTCVLVGQSADGDSEESVTIANPAAATYVVLVDGFDVPAGTTTYNYVDVFVNSAFGSIAVTDTDTLRAAGSSWTVPATVTASAAPATGRVLFGNVEVRTDENVLVGRGDVIVQSVTP